MITLVRRDFLKATTAGLGISSLGVGTLEQPASVSIGTATFTPIPDYPIQPQKHWNVTLNDRFWKPKVAINASVTIPFQIEKSEGTARGFSGNTLEAAMLALKTHPDPQLQARVEAAVQQHLQSPRAGNSGFEAAVTRYQTTGQRDLLDVAIRMADEIYEEFRLRNPPFSGGDRDAMNCVQLYRVTREKKHLDLAKHYLDIRGLENSVNRSRHNQSHKPVLEQREAVGHAVNGVTLMVSLVDVGVLSGIQGFSSSRQGDPGNLRAGASARRD